MTAPINSFYHPSNPTFDEQVPMSSPTEKKNEERVMESMELCVSMTPGAIVHEEHHPEVTSPNGIGQVVVHFSGGAEVSFNPFPLDNISSNTSLVSLIGIKQVEQIKLKLDSFREIKETSCWRVVLGTTVLGEYKNAKDAVAEASKLSNLTISIIPPLHLSKRFTFLISQTD